MPHLEKIDGMGNFTEFPGVTVIAPVENAIEEKDNIWIKLSNSLQQSKIITEYYSVLPYQSYHMTTCNLYSQDNYRSDWNSFINENLAFFQQLDNWLKNNSFSSQASIIEERTAGVLQLVLNLPDDQKKLINSFAEQFNLEDYVPGYFHITLAYGYKDFDDQTKYDALKEEFNRIISPYLGQQIELKTPTLSSFKTMKKFTPWDGKENPFVEVSFLNKAQRFFSRLFYDEKESKISQSNEPGNSDKNSGSYRR